MGVAEIQNTVFERRRTVIVALISLTLVGLVVRLWAAWQVNVRLPDTAARLVGDETGYDGLAYWVLQGVFFTWPGRTPVYPLFLAACYLVLGHSYALALYVQAFVGASVIPLTYRLARRFTGSTTALLAALIIALHPALITHVTRLYSEVLYTPLLLLALLALLRALETPQIGRYVLAGALLAVANLCRPTLVFFPAVLLLLLPRAWSLRHRMVLCAAYGGAMLAVIAPWTYHNYRTYHTFLPLSVSTALLWQGSPEFYHLMQQGHNLLDIWNEQLNPDRNGGHDAFSIAGDRYFTARAIASIRAEPLVYARYVAEKAVYFWLGNPVIDWPNQAMFSITALRPYFSPLQIVGIFVSRLFPFVALVSLLVTRQHWRAFAPLLAVCGYVMVLHALTFTEVRYSEVLHPLLATIVATAVGTMFHSFRGRRTVNTARRAVLIETPQ